LKQTGAGTGAGIVGIENRDALEAVCAQRALASDSMLALQRTLAGIAEPGGFDSGPLDTGVRQR
jgi:hypothetical protein